MLPALVERLLLQGLGGARLDAERILAELRRSGLLDDAEAAELRRAVESAVLSTRDALAPAAAIREVPGPPDVLAPLLARLDAIERRLAALEQAVAGGAARPR